MSRGPARRSFAATLGLPLVAGAATPASAVTRVARPGVRAWLQADVDAVAATGPVGVLARVESPAGAVMARAGTAERGTSRHIPWGSLLRIGSTTKPFVATVVLQLVEEGVLSLDDTVERWLPGLLRGQGNDGRTVTVRHVLQHTGGLFDYLSDAEAMPQWRSAAAFRALRFRTYTPMELVSIALRHPPDFPPGTSFAYSNTGYWLVALIIEKATGVGWETQIADRVIRPLGLRDTLSPGTDPAIRGPHPLGYFPFPDAPDLVDVTVVNQTMCAAAGGLISSPADILSFFGALSRGRLLGQDALAEMRRTVPVAGDLAEAWPGSRYGLGLQWVPQGGYWGHNGDTLGYSTRTGTTVDGRHRFFLAWTGVGDVATDAAASDLATHALYP